MPNYIQSCCIKVIILIHKPKKSYYKTTLAVKSIKMDQFQQFLLYMLNEGLI